MNVEGLLAEQRAYYRARAPEYDEWWQRRGRYDRGSDLTEEWDRQVAQVAGALDIFGTTGDVVEMARGTGWWTQRLARTAGKLTVLDSSPETLKLNRDRVGESDVEYVVADLFTWQPQRTYDAVFSSFWLSHVPRSRFRDFWSLVRSCLAPGAGCSSWTTATTRIQLARSTTPTSSVTVLIWTCAGCTTEARTRSSRSSTSPTSCGHFLATKGGQRSSKQRAGSSSEKPAWPTASRRPGQTRHMTLGRTIPLLPARKCPLPRVVGTVPRRHLWTAPARAMERPWSGEVVRPPGAAPIPPATVGGRVPARWREPFRRETFFSRRKGILRHPSCLASGHSGPSRGERWKA